VGVGIRAMTREDKPSLMQILRHTPEFKPAEVVVAEEVIDAYLDDPQHSGYFSLVAELDGAVVGYICFGPTPLTEGTWDIYWMAVAPDRRRQGIGSALMKAAEEPIRRAGGRLSMIETSSSPAYESTRRFHTKHGYETLARIPDFYTIGDDMLIMRKLMR
jgi:predicted N-acetyltransferase YhbS